MYANVDQPTLCSLSGDYLAGLIQGSLCRAQVLSLLERLCQAEIYAGILY